MSRMTLEYEYSDQVSQKGIARVMKRVVVSSVDQWMSERPVRRGVRRPAACTTRSSSPCCEPCTPRPLSTRGSFYRTNAFRVYAFWSNQVRFVRLHQAHSVKISRSFNCNRWGLGDGQAHAQKHINLELETKCILTYAYLESMFR